MAETITYQSVPNHDGWLWDDYWSCQNWEFYYYQLKEYYGKEEADRRWCNEYDKSGYGSHEINCAVKNSAFREFVKREGLDKKSTLLSKLYRAESTINQVIKPFNDLYSGVGSAVSSVGSALGGAGKTVNVLGKLLPVTTVLIVVLLVIGIGMLIFGIARNPAMLLPAGRALSMIKR